MARFTLAEVAALEREAARERRAAAEREEAASTATAKAAAKASEEARLAQERAEVARIEAREREQTEAAEREFQRLVDRRVPPARTLTIDGVTFESIWYPHKHALSLIGPRAERNEHYTNENSLSERTDWS